MTTEMRETAARMLRRTPNPADPFDGTLELVTALRVIAERRAVTRDDLAALHDNVCELADRWSKRLEARTREALDRSDTAVWEWRCDACGDAASKHNGLWRWTGKAYEHSHPNAQTHMPASCRGRWLDDEEPAKPLDPATVRRVGRWFGGRHVGDSSRTMALTLGLGTPPSFPEHPRDPADLRRCLLLLEAVPELRERLDELGLLSLPWLRLVERWQELEALLLSEVGDLADDHGRAPGTYALMREILGRAERHGFR